ncbi:helix-turn-helix domain-containing protein [Spirosoma sp. BT702]|uniref:Helix-turn-helix domain-containing protein n=1 Tax=Spirosoma profusum TaxID=2771354 RepID=A0A927AS64_9BACT|nr:helix-turn-helix domain-containing protein [Spirosoma profusum]MBD2700770.1 helix-turn-helix domain-containing protein [Spirosoma profusum]
MNTPQIQYVVVTDHVLLTRLADTLERTEKALTEATDQLSNSRLYEEDAAKLLGVEKRTMLQYRRRGLPYEKVGNIISYRRKDLDAWRSAGRTKDVHLH